MAGFADEGYEELSADEKLAIASQVLLSSPPGEIKEVLGDVKVLCPGNILTEDVLSGTFRRYNNQNNEVLTAGSTSLVLDESTEIDQDHYLDASRGKVVKVDHLVQEITDEDVQDVQAELGSEEDQENREAVEAALTEYVSSQYVKGTTALNVVVQGGNLVVLISGQKLNLKNYWGGRWQSKFVVSIDETKMDGFVKIRIHYFEDGNVQMTTDKSIDDIPLNFSDAESLGQAVKEAVMEQEGAVQNSLEEMYVNMSKETFKDMRRVLPITRQKMDWSGAQMQLAKGFGSK